MRDAIANWRSLREFRAAESIFGFCGNKTGIRDV